MTAVSVNLASNPIQATTKPPATARSADGDYKVKGPGHDVKDADGDYKPSAPPSSTVARTSIATLSAMLNLSKGG